MPSTRSAQDAVLSRCIALLTCLLHGPATSHDLSKIVAKYAGYDGAYESYIGTPIEKRFEKDRDRLRDWFGCEWDFDPQTKTYTLIAINKALFDLPDKALRGLAFLQATFSGDNVPMSQEVIALFNALQLTMSAKRRHDLTRERDLIEVDLNPRDKDPIDEKVREAVRHATMDHQELTFEYRAASRSDNESVMHRVEPDRYFFADGHYYLEAFCLETQSSKGTFRRREMWRYRIGRIVNAQVSPRRFVPGNHAIQRHELVYELSPEIARLGVTEHFPDSFIEQYADGSASVKALSTMLFIDLRKLLHYGAGCRVVGGEEAVRQMRVIVAKMYERYNEI